MTPQASELVHEQRPPNQPESALDRPGDPEEQKSGNKARRKAKRVKEHEIGIHINP